ncbi:MAG: fatty acid desaturase [Hyalangium sp.]
MTPASTPLPPLPLRAVVPPELLGRAQVPQLIRMAAIEWAWIALCEVGLLWLPAATPLFVLLIAGRLHSFGVILHDATHLPVRRKDASLWLLECLSGIPVCTSWNAMRYHHLRHHHYEGTKRDAYDKPPAGPWWQAVLLWMFLVFIIPFWVVRGPFGVLAWALPPLRTFYGRLFLLDRSREDLTHSEEVIACARADLGQVLFHLGVLALTLRWPHAMTVGYLLPLMGASGLSAYRLLSEHTPAREQGRTLQGILTSTRDHGLGWFSQLFLAPRNIGFHIVHHLHPQVALQHLPQLRAWYLQNFPEHYPRPRRR